MSKPDWLTALKNSPVAKLNKHLLELNDIDLDKSKKAKSDAGKRSSKGKSKYLSELHFMLKAWCENKEIELTTEYQFHEFRKYRFDFALKELKIAIEYEGGIFLDQSGHKSVRNYQKDVEKYNLAALEGWRVLRFTALNYKTVIQELEKLIKK